MALLARSRVALAVALALCSASAAVAHAGVATVNTPAGASALAVSASRWAVVANGQLQVSDDHGATWQTPSGQPESVSSVSAGPDGTIYAGGGSVAALAPGASAMTPVAITAPGGTTATVVSAPVWTPAGQELVALATVPASSATTTTTTTASTLASTTTSTSTTTTTATTTAPSTSTTPTGSQATTSSSAPASAASTATTTSDIGSYCVSGAGATYCVTSTIVFGATLALASVDSQGNTTLIASASPQRCTAPAVTVFPSGPVIDCPGPAFVPTAGGQLIAVGAFTAWSDGTNLLSDDQSSTSLSLAGQQVGFADSLAMPVFGNLSLVLTGAAVPPNDGHVFWGSTPPAANVLTEQNQVLISTGISFPAADQVGQAWQADDGVLALGQNSSGGAELYLGQAPSASGPISPTDQAMLSEANKFRASISEPPLQPDGLIEQAAINHSRYWVLNTASPDEGLGYHSETSGKPGFTGATAAARCAYVGTTCNSEVMDESDTPTQSVDTWMNTPYHREPILDPTAQYAAGAAANGPDVMDFDSGVDIPLRWAGYPTGTYSGPLTWAGSELPDPIAACSQQGTPIPNDGGAPISFFGAQGMTPTSLTLTSPSGPLDGCSLAGGADLAFMPAQGLQPHTSYTATAQYTIGGGPAQTATWTFTTSAASQTATPTTQPPGRRAAKPKRKAALTLTGEGGFVAIGAPKSFSARVRVRVLGAHAATITTKTVKVTRGRGSYVDPAHFRGGDYKVCVNVVSASSTAPAATCKTVGLPGSASYLMSAHLRDGRVYVRTRGALVGHTADVTYWYQSPGHPAAGRSLTVRLRARTVLAPHPPAGSRTTAIDLNPAPFTAGDVNYFGFTRAFKL